MQLRDQHVLITGGSSGIGLALALRAVAAGESFIVTNHGLAVAVLTPIAAPDYGGLSVQRADRTRRIRELEPAEGRLDETTAESIEFLRGES